MRRTAQKSHNVPGCPTKPGCRSPEPPMGELEKSLATEVAKPVGNLIGERDGEFDPEFTTDAFGGFDTDFAVHAFNGSFDDR